MTANNNTPKLLSDEELRAEIIRLLNEYRYSGAIMCREIANTVLPNLINTQKRLYAESVIGDDEFGKHWCGTSCDDTSHIANQLRAEQRKRLNDTK